MFCDETKIKIGETFVKIKRLTVAEIKQARVNFQEKCSGADDEYERLLNTHCTLEDGSKIDIESLSLPQMQTLVKEMIGIPEGSGISDFIGLLC